jgi:hypothetical protein
MISDKDWAEAEERGRIRELTFPYAVAASYDESNGTVTVKLNRGFSVSFHKNRSQTLHKATNEQLRDIEVHSTSIFFPKLDDGFSVEGMLAGRFGTRRWEREWADAHQIEIAENTLTEHTAAA